MSTTLGMTNEELRVLERFAHVLKPGVAAAVRQELDRRERWFARTGRLWVVPNETRIAELMRERES